MGLSINDIARRSGYSKKTVSRVLNNEGTVRQSTRAKIEAIINELGFIPNSAARGLALGRSLLLALVHDNPNPHTVINFQRAMLEALRETDFAMVVDQVDRHSGLLPSQLHAFLTRHRPSGVIFLPPISERADLIEVCDKLGVPSIQVASARIVESGNLVWSRDREAVHAAVTRLIKQGHRRWGIVRGPGGFCSATERAAGFANALEEAGLALNSQYEFSGDYTFASGREVGRLLTHRQVDNLTLFCCNDEMAAGILHELHLAKIPVPSRVALLGFDDSPTSRHLVPQISTLRWPIERMASLAVERVLGRISGETAAGPEGLLPSLMERGSTKYNRPIRG